MDNEFLSFALKSTLDEIQKTCPEIKTAFALDANRELIAQGENTPEDTLARAVELLREVLKKADTVSGAEELTIQGTDGRVNVSHIDEIYLVTVTSKHMDLKYADAVVHVLVPTVLRVLEKLGPAPIRRTPPELETEPEISVAHETEQTTESPVEETEEKEPEEQPKHEQGLESSLPEAPVNQFIVEDIKGMLIPSDTVRIDNSVIGQWKELYEGKDLDEAELETFAGKSVRCKVKPIKDGKLEGQGKIQIPSKLQDVLDIKKGELIRVKPAVE